MQVVIIQWLGGIFKTVRQSWQEWLFSIGVGASALPVAFLTKFFTRSVGWKFDHSYASVVQRLL